MEATNNRTEDKKLKKLMRKVDKNFEKNPLKIQLKNIGFSLPFILVFILLGYLLYVIANVIAAGFSQFSTETQVSLLLAETVGLIAFSNLAINIPKAISPQTTYKELVNYNYKRLKDKVSESDRLLLKALIMMRSKQPEFDLEVVSKQKDGALNKKRLLERLYE